MSISVRSLEDSEYSGYAIASSGFLGENEGGEDGSGSWSLGDPAAFAAAGFGDELARFDAVQDSLAVNDFVLTVGKEVDADYNDEEHGWFKTRKGKAAKGMYAEWQDRARRIWQEDAPKSLNSRQRELAQKPLTALFAAHNRRVGGFEAENLLTWNMQRAELAVNDALNLAAANAPDPEGLALALASLRNSYAALAQMNGWDETTTAEHTNRAVGTMLAKSAAALAGQDPRKALDFMVAHRDLIPDDPALEGLFLQTMEAGYEHLIRVDPEQALALLRDGPDGPDEAGGPRRPGAADETDETGGPDETVRTDGADGAGRPGVVGKGQEAEASMFAAEYRKHVPPERIALMRGRAEAELRSRERLIDERMAALRAGLDASLLRVCLEGDCGPLQKAEEQLAGLDKKDEAQTLAAMRPLLVQGHSWLEARRFEPFDSQRIGLEEFYGAAGRAAGSGNRGDEDGRDKAEKDRAGIEKGGGEAGKGRTRAGAGRAGEPPAFGAAAGRADLIPGVLAVSRQAVNERQSLFAADPAAYVALHPLLGGIDPASGEALGIEDFCEREGISWEDHIDRSLRLQVRVGKGSGIAPRVLSRDRAAAIRDSFESLENPREKAALLRDLARRGGKHADRVFTEAGLPVSVSAYAALYPNMPASEITRLLRASDASLDSLDLTDSRKAEIRRRVQASPLSKTLRLVDHFFASAQAGLERNSAGQGLEPSLAAGQAGESSPATGGQGAAAGQGAEQERDLEPSPVVGDLLHSLESFVALGGNLEDLERRITLDVWPVLKAHLKGMAVAAGGTALLAGGIAGAAAGIESPANADRNPSGQDQESGQAPAKQRTWWDQTGHELSYGTRNVIEGVLGLADIPATILREPMNMFAEAIGFGPNVFQPAGKATADMLGLDTPETDRERMYSNIQQSLAPLPFAWWGGSALGTGRGWVGVSAPVRESAKGLSANPIGDVASTIGAEVLAQWVENNGGGPAAVVVAAVLGGGLGGSAGKKMGAALGLGDDAAKAGIKAEAKAQAKDGRVVGKALDHTRTKITNHEIGVTGVSKANRQIMATEDWKKAKEGSMPAAHRVVEQIWTPQHTAQLKAKLDPARETVFVAVPSSSGTNRLPDALGERLAKELGGSYVDVQTLYRIRAKNAMKEVSKIERPFAARQYIVENSDAVRALQGKQVVITEDIFTTGSSVRRFALELRKQGVEVQTVAGLMGNARLDASPQQVDKLQRTLRNAKIDIKGKELAQVLSAGEIDSIIGYINKSGGANEREQLAKRLQGLLNR